MKLSQKNQHKFVQYRTYSHHDHDIDDLEGEFWPVMGILLTILGAWTGVIHFIDYLTWNTIPWWAEPFTIAPVIFLIVMKEKYDLPIGYSGHETSVSPSLTAAALGAQVIERHVTLDRTMWGTDHSASLEVNGMIQLVNLIKKFEKSYGNGVKKITENEKIKLKAMKYW